MLAATKRLLVIGMRMVIRGIIGMFVVILGIIGMVVVILGIIGMCRVVIVMVVSAAIIVMAIVGIVTGTVGMNTVGLLVASNNLTFCVIITDWSG